MRHPSATSVQTDYLFSIGVLGSLSLPRLLPPAPVGYAFPVGFFGPRCLRRSWCEVLHVALALARTDALNSYCPDFYAAR